MLQAPKMVPVGREVEQASRKVKRAHERDLESPNQRSQGNMEPSELLFGVESDPSPCPRRREIPRKRSTTSLRSSDDLRDVVLRFPSYYGRRASRSTSVVRGDRNAESNSRDVKVYVPVCTERAVT